MRFQRENISAHTHLADVLEKQKHSLEARAHRAMASFLQGREAGNKNNSAEAKEQFRKALKWDATATMELAGQVCTLKAPNSFALLDGPASTCAEAGRAADTTNALQKVINLAEAAGQNDVVKKYRAMMERYRPGAAPPLLRRPE